MLDVKICGITDKEAINAAVAAEASFVGFVFYPPSPRALKAEVAQQLAQRVPAYVTTVGLFVDASDDRLITFTRSAQLGLLQLHGKETPERVAEIRNLINIPVIKAIGINTEKDFEQVAAYEEVADMLLFDAKPSRDAKLPGGNAESFNWALLKGREFKKPWMLAGGLNVRNLADAVKQSGARMVDISSGVEDRPGHKNPDKIRSFLELSKQL